MLFLPVNLDFATAIPDVEKLAFAHDALRSDASSQTNPPAFLVGRLGLLAGFLRLKLVLERVLSLFLQVTQLEVPLFDK